MMKLNIQELNEYFAHRGVRETLEYFLNLDLKVGFSTSFGVEDQVITDLINDINPSTYIFSLDTGMLHEETYKTMDETIKKYNDIEFKFFYPDTAAVEKMVAENGINLFYESRQKRALCCQIRKVEPLKRALKGVDIWITGRRSEQSDERSKLDLLEYDEAFGVYKLNPLHNWGITMVWEYIKQNKTPYNELHDRSYPSIGCEPCTRAVKAGESFRTGRWWWEDDAHKECGLHIKGRDYE